MSRRVIVPRPISEYIRDEELPRSVVVSVLTRLHVSTVADYERFCRYRVPGYEDDQYRYRFVVADGDIRHLFVFAIDDKTSPDHLIVADIRHMVSDES